MAEQDFQLRCANGKMCVIALRLSDPGLNIWDFRDVPDFLFLCLFFFVCLAVFGSDCGFPDVSRLSCLV